ncbi:hypothetical protein RRF57_006484 [Xylaria bambusicola]|uniref:Uncharacterized protein n=1 Tax=Xylaria bambusicola TaxID=326684 RepID=A0AAN7UZE6_9PEZI
MISSILVNSLPEISTADGENSDEPQLVIVGYIASDTLQVRRVKEPALGKLHADDGESLREDTSVYPCEVTSKLVARGRHISRRTALLGRWPDVRGSL